MKLLDTITQLSHEFGYPEYVKGGGGNSSCKTDDTLWVKPSGTTLAGMEPERFVALDRKKISGVYGTTPPENVNERERLVVKMMADAVRPDSAGRPSVETPLHDSFSGVYVVHTHAELVNGLTCANNGEAECARLFPEALWVEYVDPGWTLCRVVRERIVDYKQRHGQEPKIVMLDNHGIFVQGDTADEVRDLYDHVMKTLEAEYEKAGISMTLHAGPEPEAGSLRTVADAAQEAFGDEAAFVIPCGLFHVPRGPITPDHIVYSKSYPFVGDQPTARQLLDFKNDYGYMPRIIETAGGVYGLGPTEKMAALALDLARDGALLENLADAFGGIEYLTEAERAFIENWEAEAYRQQQV